MVRCVAPVLPFACLKAMPVHKAVRPIGYVAALSCLALLSVVVADNGRAAAVPPVLDIPVACEPGRDCFIQFYVDRDESVGIADYRCAGLTYDGHKGTDFRLADLPAMRRGVAVRAAVAGTVRAIRDGEPDISADLSERSLEGREAGNAVVLMHDDGWETQYSHLMKGSIIVRKGQRVRAGEALGLIGLSGNSTFPHLDFSVRHAGEVVDPFSGGAASEPCARGGLPLWSAAAEKKLDYLPGAVLLAGFAGQITERRDVRDGGHRATELSTLAPVLVFWVDMFGLSAGDVERFRILAPDGTVVAESEQVLENGAHQHFQSIGRLRPTPTGWPPGDYRGEYLLFREIDGERRALIGAVREVTLR
jgi:hypothetical protein